MAPKRYFRTFNSQLQTTTIHLLRSREPSLTLEKIALETGLGISWLNKFANSIAGNASVDKVETLYNYLKGSKLVC